MNANEIIPGREYIVTDDEAGYAGLRVQAVRLDDANEWATVTALEGRDTDDVYVEVNEELVFTPDQLHDPKARPPLPDKEVRPAPVDVW